MPEDGGDMAGETGQRKAKTPKSRVLFEWTALIMTALAGLSILARNELPHELGLEVSTTLLNAMVLVFIIALPLLEVILWRLRKELPRDGYWGPALLLMGAGILAPCMAIYVGIETFVSTPFQPTLLVDISLLVMCAAFVMAVLGLLIVLAQLPRNIVQLFRGRRQSRISDQP